MFEFGNAIFNGGEEEEHVVVGRCSSLDLFPVDSMGVECKEDRSDYWSWFSVRIACSWSAVHMPAMSWVGMWGGGMAVLSWMLCMSSSCKTIMGGW